ncbi:NAD(P)H dehydrogenase (quinone) (plasmid) [Trichormus variabilis ATCC 29413]|uniref:FMN-dependent NADH:quinone oxidoreductase 1 n=2 Tax=Anabaena variabilis TaxID=264691 RepID=AZOR1_TRIV2|nr:MULTISPECIES: FMN-dependent NADH-azoreductase [Nostocaceae]Q3M1N6.1 RecName: Full=FMN-dependent NADH:quinone oxidoreductase 1; AltName: Full=Azo-dye reductase 1; AltName: Full=FMN-dependent NADH-azo compound oxidoreductase 1; AltName: Full=FMN-dependent NADH-azoreductase 1 [Trichormus variabilis ATCC 29413]ABA25114.1 NAD(P)H dehydrogenase (quinone) [Trichormus variabilis ATCC 29413]MBC1218234.1 FMN-dependent NADH-azoreductase [Trichormus variabilis ARAD]MBC1259560.1 FMN-dependent NADH-azored
MKLLHLDSSPRGERSISRSLTQQFVSLWKQMHLDVPVIYRDLGRYPVPAIDEAWIAAAFCPPAQLTPELQSALMISDELIAELLAANLYIFGIPMYNYSVPASFKAYIDQIVRVRRTFVVSADGYEGLLKDKKVLVITTRGGSYAGEPLDFQEPYLRAVFGFIGITDVTFIHAENLAIGSEERQLAIATAHEAIQQVVKTWQSSTCI